MSRPRILLNCDLDPGPRGSRLRARATVYRHYLSSVVEGGGLPIPVPPSAPRVLEEYLDLADGVLFTGGDDYPPELYGERPRPEVEKAAPERTASDLALMRLALRSPKPALGICAGLQLLNIAQGGALLQHLPRSMGHTAPGPEKDASHEVRIAPRTRLAAILGSGRARVNSSHHQAADPARIGRGLRVTAEAEDGTVEGLELARPEKRFFVFVQWHPERMADARHRRRLFKAFVDACRR